MPTYASEVTARKLWETLDRCRRTGSYSHTFGALDPVQVVHMAPHLTSIYVSGWQSSSTASTTYVATLKHLPCAYTFVLTRLFTVCIVAPAAI